MRVNWGPVGLAVMTLILISPAGISVSKPVAPAFPFGQVPTQGLVVWGPSSTHIQHVITVVMENRDYDNYFGTYCLVAGPYCSTTGNGLPQGLCVPNNPTNISLGCTKPFNLTTSQFVTSDMPHDWISGPKSWANGAMDGFYEAEGKGTLPFGHYNGSTIPIYWDMAEEYATSDNLFAANLSYSLPNHWYLVAGAAPNITQGSYIKSTADHLTYLNESNHTATVQDLLNATNLTWKYYDYGLANYSTSITTTGVGSAYDYWNPLAARAESYYPSNSAHITARSDFLGDLANGSLPQISWVIPDATYSDHPGYNVTLGEEWVAQLVDAVEASPDWNSTAIFVVWDDYGGWYDHVSPPRVDTKLLSFRSPILVISPYSKENYISHTFLDFYSLLHYVEWQFDLGCLTALDCSAPLPFDFFNFNETARSPILFPTVWTSASYPIPLQNSTVTHLVCTSCLSTIPKDWSTNSPPNTNFSLGD